MKPTPAFLDPTRPTVGMFLNLEQGSDEWLEFRKSKITATGAYELIQGRSIKSILDEKATKEDTFTGNKYTERGHLLENEARKLYSDLNSVEVDEVGAAINTKYPDFACSPDGLVGTDGGIEIKCFTEERQQALAENLDPRIITQIQFNLFITERDWWDLVMYNPEIEDVDKAYQTTRFTPDLKMFKKFEDALEAETPERVRETAIQIINLEAQLRAQSEMFRDQLNWYNQTKAQIAELKQQLKEKTQGKIKEEISIGDNTLSISIHDTNRVSVDSPEKVPEEYTTETKVDNVYLGADGEFYQKVPNSKLISNFYKANGTLPEGCSVKTSRSISLKFNGDIL